MALIGQIRQKGSWILVVMIALGLGGFIFMDMNAGPTSVFGSAQPTVGKVNGEKLDLNEFNRTENILYQNSAADIYSRREQLWSYFVNKTLMRQEAEALGLAVSDAELEDLQFGSNPSPIIRQRFMNPTTGQIDYNQLNQIRDMLTTGTMEPNMMDYWQVQEGEIVAQRLQEKLNGMVSKGMYIPTWMAEDMYEEQAQVIEFAYVKISFADLDNSEVSLGDEDFKTYIKENEEALRVDEERRALKFVTFNVIPTAEDSASIREKITEIIPEFENAENDTTFIQRNQGIMEGTYFKKDQLSAIIADTVWSLSSGSVYGPYLEGATFKAVKVLDRMMIPDSVESRHILRPVQTQEEFLAAQQLLDSIKTEIESGNATFADMAAQFGTDATVSTGGDLGYAAPGQMVGPFNDLIFFQADLDSLYIIGTQFGLHLVEVTDRRHINNEEGIRVAYLSEDIKPSENTQQAVADRAYDFMRKHQEDGLAGMESDAAGIVDISISSSGLLNENSYQISGLGTGQEPREMVRWAFEGKTKPGDVAPRVFAFQDPVRYFNNRYVVIALDRIVEPGLPAVEDIRADIEPIVTNHKKGEVIKSRIQSEELTAIASAFDVPVDTVPNVTFANDFIQEIGGEPKVLGTVFTMEEGETSEPIIGASGVFVLKITEKAVPSAPLDLPAFRRQQTSSQRATVGNRLMTAIREEATIKDNRARYY